MPLEVKTKKELVRMVNVLTKNLTTLQNAYDRLEMTQSIDHRMKEERKRSKAEINAILKRNTALIKQINIIKEVVK